MVTKKREITSSYIFTQAFDSNQLELELILKCRLRQMTVNQIGLVRAQPRTKFLDRGWQLPRTFTVKTDDLDAQFFDGLPPVRRAWINSEDGAADSRRVKVLEVRIEQALSTAGAERFDYVHHV